MLGTFPKLVEEYAEIIRQSALTLKEKKIFVDRETRKIRVPPLVSSVTLFGIPVQPLLTGYHGIEGVNPEKALSGWDDIALAIANNEPPTAVRKYAKSVFPTYGFPLDTIAIGTQFLGLCARAGVGYLYGDGDREVGLKRDRTFVGFTRRAVHLSREHTFRSKFGYYTARVKGTRGLMDADFTGAYTMEKPPILIRPTLAGVRALLLEAYPDERPGIDIVLGVISTSHYRHPVNPSLPPGARARIGRPPGSHKRARVQEEEYVEVDYDDYGEAPEWERNLVESFNVEEVEGAPPLYDEWELLRRLVKNARYDATPDIYGALKDVPYYEFVSLFGVPINSGQLTVYSEKLRRKHLASIEKLVERVAMTRNGPDITQTLEIQSLVSRLV